MIARLAVLTFSLCAASGVLAEPRLRPTVTVDGPQIVLADLFDGIDPRAAGVVVSPSPAPGEKLYLRPQGVAATAQAAGIAWQPAAELRPIMVSRFGRAVPRREVIEQLTDALAEHVHDGSFEVTLAAAPTGLYVGRNAAPSVRVDSVEFEPRTGRFTALVAAPANDRNAEVVRVSGRVTATSSVPVLRNRVAPGETIGKADVEWKDIPTSRVNRGYVVDIDALVGRSPKRLLMPGQPVREYDVQRPQTVVKNAMVTMSVSMPGLALTALGRAIDGGANGDVIEVMNVQTKKTVQAVVMGPNLVQVAPPSLALPVSN